MKRDIQWIDRGTIAESLVTPERNMEIQEFIEGIFVNGVTTLQDIVDALNERGDLTDNEWTAAIFALGHWNARMGYD